MKTRSLIFATLLFVVLLPLRLSANPGDIYVTDNTNIWKFSPDGTGTLFASVPSRPRGMAFDKSGNLFVGVLDTNFHDGQGRVLKFAPDGTFTVFATGLGFPQGMAFDRGGNLLVAGSSPGILYKVTPSGNVTALVTFDPDVNASEPFGVAFDFTNTLFLADAGGNNNGIYMINPAGRTSTFVNLDTALDVAFDTKGNLFVTQAPGGIEPGDNHVLKVEADGTISTFATLPSVRGLAFDSQGNLFVAGHLSNNVYKITSDGTVSVFAAGLNVTQRVAIEGAVLPPPPPAALGLPANRPTSHPSPGPHSIVDP